MRKHSKEYLENLTPYKCYEILVEGNQRFINNLNTNHDHLEMINETQGWSISICCCIKLYGFPCIS